MTKKEAIDAVYKEEPHVGTMIAILVQLGYKTNNEIDTLIKDIKNLSGSHIFCLVIAQNIKEKGPDSIFLSRPVIKLLPEAVMAARFLVKFQLI